jgi:regulatory protein
VAARRRTRIRELSSEPELAARQAKDLCLRVLTDRARTRHELAEVLADEGVPEDVATSVLDRLVELRLLDDAAYAEAFVRSRQRAGAAKRSLTRELRSKGVGEDEAEAALSTIDPEQEREAAFQLAVRRATRTSGLPLEVRRRRLYGVLARRGYPSDVVAAAVEHALTGPDVTDGPVADGTGDAEPDMADEWGFAG